MLLLFMSNQSDEQGNQLLVLQVLELVRQSIFVVGDPEILHLEVVQVDQSWAVSRAAEASGASVHRVAEVDSRTKDNISVVVVLLVVINVPVVVDGVGVVSGVFDNLVINGFLFDVGSLSSRSSHL